ncbi:hypothetical protein BIW11_02843 [Tropilaelaps mercedesae]|uniref:Uncharacterized protein n=1 Tax=Tropilaelaps mercedesae TaxID=418985 RepID=A0A1V9XWQ7_9ACAR|nr:hypothetical protein BIW11_02843 [Tropilaelaps mercedesae]
MAYRDIAVSSNLPHLEMVTLLGVKPSCVKLYRITENARLKHQEGNKQLQVLQLPLAGPPFSDNDDCLKNWSWFMKVIIRYSLINHVKIFPNPDTTMLFV